MPPRTRIEIGIVNNMPDAALVATERQFSRLIEQASGDLDINISLYTLESLPRQPGTLSAIGQTYRPARELRAHSPDALIVTGAEPHAPDLRDEPYWRELAGLAAWAQSHTISCLFSCLAAHAEVLRRDTAEIVYFPTGSQAGWYAGIEFSGRTRISLERSGNSLKTVLGLDPDPGPFRTRLVPGGSFETPTVFLGAHLKAGRIARATSFAPGCARCWATRSRGRTQHYPWR